MNNEEFLRLTTLYLEDAINAYDLDLLNRELAHSPDRVQQFNDLRLVTGLIEEHGCQVESVTPADLPTKTLMESRNNDSFVAGSVQATASQFRTSHFGLAIAGAVLATAASLFIFLPFPDTQSQRNNDSPAIARLAYASHAKWGIKERSQGDRFNKGKVHLETGLARLDFCNGATVTLQGPAEFEIVSPDRTVLSSGILTASVPDSAVGFKVLTPAMDVVDLGTAFGVSVGGNGETDVCVFEGEVEVSRTDSKNTPQLVREGSAVRSSPKAESIDSVAYATMRYENAWPVTSGVLQSTGLMKFVSPGPDFVPGRIEDSNRILVFRECSRVILESDLEVNVTEPGQYIRVRRWNRQSIGAGQVVGSYLLQLNPIGEFFRNENDGARVIGQITFNRPILGLIGGTTQLISTDELLGHPRGNYGNTRRGIEPARPDDQPDSGRDNVTLSNDRRTLSLDLSASSAVDQIRVIVLEQPQIAAPSRINFNNTTRNETTLSDL
ncbi:MAG: FecR domain-containing protein [Pirellulales bacterium]|nr:FecR domain-containing protein [Pirellulales bacterium]